MNEELYDKYVSANRKVMELLSGFQNELLDLKKIVEEIESEASKEQRRLLRRARDMQKRREAKEESEAKEKQEDSMNG